jgi:hypothetical protein
MNYIKRFFMKKITIYRILAFLVTLTVVLGSCTKEMSEVRLEPTLSTSQTFGVKSDSATVVGFVVAQGDGFTERGVCYNTAANPTIDNSKVAYTKDTPSATFNVVLSGLKYATKYYARAYATSDGLTVYGEEVTFTTLPVKPTLTTAAMTEITGNSASAGGNVTVTGGATVTARGVCYGLSPNPTVADTKTTNGDGPGEFVSALTGLKGNTKYYLRAYATNSAGTGYGPEVSFTTLVDLPVVTTATVTEITKTTAVSGGEVTSDGGGNVTERGIVWGMNSDPTISNNKIITGVGTGVFVSNLTNLEKFTTYHVRAYAVNSAGVAYGADAQFTTMGDNLTWNIPGDYVEASYPGSGLANWSPDKSPQVKSTVSSPDNLEGYVFMANSDNQWKFATQNNWNGPNYGDGGGGSLSASADNIHSPNGYYKLNANSANLTYTAVATVWGVIGSATPNEWNDETPLAYDPASRTWRGVMHLTAAEIKFRANHNWDFNYGSDNADGKLNAGGKNIPVSLESDYAIVLDLSHPNEYTYITNRWGLIGDAQGSWDKDTDMKWDATNNVFTVTLDLVSSGSFKFRANDAWDINYGGDINNLTPGGDNITIGSNGNYTVTFDPWNLKATVKKN